MQFTLWPFTTDILDVFSGNVVCTQSSTWYEDIFGGYGLDFLCTVGQIVIFFLEFVLALMILWGLYLFIILLEKSFSFLTKVKAACGCAISVICDLSKAIFTGVKKMFLATWTGVKKMFIMLGMFADDQNLQIENVPLNLKKGNKEFEF